MKIRSLHDDVGNMMQSVVLDGNPLNEDEDLIMLAGVVLDGKRCKSDMK